MKEQHIIAYIPDYLDGLLKEDKRRQVETHIDACDTCRKAFDEMQILFKAFEAEESSEPSPTVRENFFAQIEQEKEQDVTLVQLRPNKKNNLWLTPLKIAAGLALLIGAFQWGTYRSQLKTNQKIAALEQQQNEIRQTAMLSLMENQSASKRILGVNYIEELNKPDEAIVAALAERMLQDENINVRLTAAEALGRFSASQSVKRAFIQALKSEKDPAIQITIIHILVKIQEKNAVDPMRELLEKEETQPFVKQEIKSLLPNII